MHYSPFWRNMCKSPLKGFPIGVTENHKTKYMITSYHVDHVEKWKDGWKKIYDPFISSLSYDYVKEFTEIPCGHCIECYLNYSMQWANRCMLELTNYEPCECWFLTLTYDNEHIPYIDAASDVISGTLLKDDLQKFWKRLRQFVERDIGEKSRLRYFACGEYGSTTLRPHYHAILYGFPWVDLQSWSMSKSGFPLFRSPLLESIWKNGIVTVSPVSWNTCAYTARYVLKKADKSIDQSFYDINGLTPEYVTMSRRPGIGKEYFDLHKDQIYKFDEIILKLDDGGKIIKPPKYYDSLFEAEDPSAYEEIKERRQEKAQATKMWKLSHTDKEYLEMLQAEAETLNGKLKALRRDKL